MKQKNNSKKSPEKQTPKPSSVLVKKFIVLALMVLSMVVVLLLPQGETISFQMVNTSSLSYVRAKVLSVDSESLEYDSMEPDRRVGTQLLTVELLEGAYKGQVIQLTNYMTRGVNVDAKAGQRIVVCVDMPEHAEPYYTVYNYDRQPTVIAIGLVFCLVVLLIGRGKGAWSLLGLGYTVFMILLFLVRVIFYGGSIVLYTLGTIAVTAAAALLLLGGPSRKTMAALISTLLGVAIAGLVFAVFSLVLHLSGYNLDTAESLLLIAQGAGMEMKQLLLGAVLITALGAVMDVAMSVSSSLEEIHNLRPELGAKDLVRSGMTIGRDMIGTMTNTLILAYAGSALTTILLLKGYGYGFSQLISSDYLAMELSQGVAATMGVVLTVPAASLTAAVLLTYSASGKKISRTNRA